MADDIGFLIKKIQNAIRSEADNNMRSLDVTLPQTRVLSFLMHRERHTAPQKEIETFFCVTHPTMIGILHRLEAKGFVDVRVNREDKRMKDVALTEAGERAASLADCFRRKTEEAMTAGLSDGDRSQLVSLLGRVLDNLVAHSAADSDPWRHPLKEEKHD